MTEPVIDPENPFEIVYQKMLRERREEAIKSLFPPVTSENMLKQSRREGWQYQEHPVRFLRGKDHA